MIYGYFLKNDFTFANWLHKNPDHSMQAYSDKSFMLRLKKLKFDHARVLLVWAALNITTGIAIVFVSNERLHYFLMMNIVWGIINSGFAAFIFYHHNDVFELPQNLLQQLDHQRHVEKVIPFNIGLDIAFIAAGMSLYFYGSSLKEGYIIMWKSFGVSVMVQGSYLLVQDIIFYRLHVLNRTRVYPTWKKMMEHL